MALLGPTDPTGAVSHSLALLITYQGLYRSLVADMMTLISPAIVQIHMMFGHHMPAEDEVQAAKHHCSPIFKKDWVDWALFGPQGPMYLFFILGTYFISFWAHSLIRPCPC